jgi:ubiquitin carboxyl-terminal hydrolase 8
VSVAYSQLTSDGSFKKAINYTNPLGTKGNLAGAFAELLKALWAEEYTFLSPVTFRVSLPLALLTQKNIITFASQFSGTDQHDSQEFLSFVLDGLHEDLNRVKVKPAPVEMTPDRESRLETLPPEIASEQEWEIYRQRNDSFIVDLFQGQYRNRLECLTCHKVGPLPMALT